MFEQPVEQPAASCKQGLSPRQQQGSLARYRNQRRQGTYRPMLLHLRFYRAILPRSFIARQNRRCATARCNCNSSHKQTWL